MIEKEILSRWAETGCEPGNPADMPKPPKFPEGWRLGQPDLVLTMPETFGVPADGPDIYRSFALPFPLDHDVTINGVEVHPGNRRVVHHSRLYLDETGDARRRERFDPQPGFSSWFGISAGQDLPYPGMGGWTPGMTPRFAPDGVGRTIRRGSDIVLQLHYHPTGKPEPDRSSIGLFFARAPVTRKMAGYVLCTDKIDIPPGEKRHKIILSTRLKADIHLYTVVPHAHYLCREFRLAATLPDGTIQPLLWINDWDLDWQDQYRYAKPVRLPKGTVVTLAAYFDNTEENPKNPFKPPRRVRYGVETKDEMCAATWNSCPTTQMATRPTKPSHHSACKSDRRAMFCMVQEAATVRGGWGRGPRSSCVGFRSAKARPFAERTSLAASQRALIVLSRSDSYVPPARESAPASTPSLWACRRDVRAGSIPWRGGRTQGASRLPPPSSGIAGD